MEIPVVILILEKDDQIFYRAYSPCYFDTQEISRSELYDQFIHRIYDDVGYNPLTPLISYTHYGDLKEVHTRYIHIPIENRGETCFFSTYDNPLCRYRPVHRNTPIYFNQNLADDHRDPNLYSHSCSHQII
jgi:hypothetical protein